MRRSLIGRTFIQHNEIRMQENSTTFGSFLRYTKHCLALGNNVFFTSLQMKNKWKFFSIATFHFDVLKTIKEKENHSVVRRAMFLHVPFSFVHFLDFVGMQAQANISVILLQIVQRIVSS